MQHQSISPDPKRDAAAAKLAEGAGQWVRVTLTQPWGAFPVGTVFYRVPSRTRPSVGHLANAVACRCEDYQQNGAICAHVRAVRIVERTRQQEQDGSAEEADPTPAVAPLMSYRELYPGCAAGCGDLVEKQGQRCYACTSDLARRLDMAAKRVAVGV